MPIEVSTVEPGIICVTISNPVRCNALDLDMFKSLAALWPSLAHNSATEAVILQGEGGMFCSGADLASHLDRYHDIDEIIDRALLKTHFFPKPLVASISGTCVAGGLELALAADIRIADENARIGLPEVCWGIMPSGGGAMKLIDQIGHAKAMDLLLTGRLISAREAATIGLVTEVSFNGGAWDLALGRARSILANSPIAVRSAKRAALFSRSQRYRALETDERRLVASVRKSGHPEEGKVAFLEKRQPNFGDVGSR